MAGRCAGPFRLGTKVQSTITAVLVAVLALPLTALGERAIRTRVAPVYPEIAKRLHVEGVVKIEVTVDSEGKVLEVKTLSGSHTLSVAAEDAVRKWKFAPGSGEEKVSVDVNFSLEH
jgi:TonB family protein